MSEVTKKQYEALQCLALGPIGTGAIAFKTHDSIDAAHSRMRGLENRLLVRRIQDGVQSNISWELTSMGRKVLAKQKQIYRVGR